MSARGWIAVPEARLEQVPHERHLRQVLAAYRIDCVLDVGAGLGQFRDLLRNGVGYTGSILSFEPVREHFNAMERRAGLDEAWRVFPTALGSETRLVGSEPRRVCRLDDVFLEATTGLRCRRVFLRLGAPGCDLEVLQGAGQVLQAVSAIQAGLSPGSCASQAEPDYLTCMRSLNELGYEVSGMFPLRHDYALRASEMDCVMVRHGDHRKEPRSPEAVREASNLQRVGR
jgi:hypothetical protein